MSSSPAAAGLTLTQPNDTWGSEWEWTSLSGSTPADDAVGSILHADDGGGFFIIQSVTNPSLFPANQDIYFTTDWDSPFDIAEINHNIPGVGLPFVAQGTVQVNGQTEYIWKLSYVTQSESVQFAPKVSLNSNDPFYIRLWDGDPALFAPDSSGLLPESVETGLNEWDEVDPALTAASTLTEPFDFGTVLSNAASSGQILTAKQIKDLNDWRFNEPALAVIDPINPFSLGDVLNEAMGTPPISRQLKAREIKKLNEWSNSDPSLFISSTLNSPFRMGDYLNELLTRS